MDIEAEDELGEDSKDDANEEGAETGRGVDRRNVVGHISVSLDLEDNMSAGEV